jgi:hyperosmotically inducible protein
MRRRTLALLLAAVSLWPGAVLAQSRDAALAERAADAIRSYAQFTIFDDVSIQVSNGTARLTGAVTAPLKRTEIGVRVSRVDGIEQVDNAIVVLPVSPYDSSLRTRIAQAIYSHSAFWHYASMANPPIHIVVDRGRVTLTGRVNNEVERRLAYALANVDGTFSVTNRLKLDREQHLPGHER